MNTGDKLYIMPDDTFVCKDDYLAAGQNGGGKSQKHLIDTLHVWQMWRQINWQKHKLMFSGFRL